MSKKTKSSLDGQSRGYKIFVIIVLALLAVFFIFPLYWILTGSLKDAITINAQKPQWFPLNPPLTTMYGCSSSPPSSGC